MELGKYPFSERYGWCEDKYGLSWQVIHVGDRPATPRFTPVLMFVGDVLGKTEEAIDFYTSVFPDSKKNMIARYEKGETDGMEGSIKYGSFTLLGSEFGAIDGAGSHNFKFSEAISFIVSCDTQKEIDYYWEKLSSDPQFEQCGWLKDKYGVFWQIVPSLMEKVYKEKDEKKLEKFTKAFLQMKKFDIAKLEKAAK